MSLSFILTIIFTFWSVCYLLNTFLLECRFTSASYAKFLSKNGLSINLFQIKWYTVKCNRLFIKLSNWRPHFLKCWFNAGILVCLLGQFLSVILLIYTLVDFFKIKPTSQQILVPVLPGVNLPTNQTGYYFIALLVCGLVHEFGHAIAASREQVRVNGFGVFVMFIFPGAYVDLCSDHLQVISPVRQLRIFCAGVWHNFVLVLLCIACIQLHPYFVQSLFDKKVHVYDIAQSSPLKSIFPVNAVISKVGNCDVNSSFSFYECLYKFDMNPNLGYCMTADEIKHLSTSLIQNDLDLNECCHTKTSATNYCFKWTSIELTKQHYSCLPARFTTEKTSCTQNSDCKELYSALEKSCVVPVWNNVTKLFRIVHDKGQPILYVGSVQELIYSLVIDDLMPKFKFIPKFLNSQLLMLLKYLVAFSGAIGLMNLVPCFALDGQFILAALLSVNKSSPQLLNSNESKFPKLYIAIMMFGTALLLLNILLALFSLIISKTGSIFT